MLINVAPKRPEIEAMDPNAVDLTPGRPPPWLSPHCFKCKLPVETFTVDWIASPHYLPIQATCHGQTRGLRIPREEVLYKSKYGGVIEMFKDYNG